MTEHAEPTAVQVVPADGIVPGLFDVEMSDGSWRRDLTNGQVRSLLQQGVSMPWPFNFEAVDVLAVVVSVMDELPPWQRQAFEQRIGEKVIERAAKGLGLDEVQTP